MTEHLDFLLKNYNQKTIAGFTGSILQYDVNYRPVTNTVYEEGEERGLLSSAFVQGGKKSKLLTSMMRASSDCMPVSPTVYGLPPGIGEDCVVTWIANYTYDEDGCIVTYTLTYVSSSCPGDGTGGSGSGSGSGSASSPGEDVPPYGGGGGGGGSSGPGTPSLNAILGSLSNLTQTQKEQIEEQLENIKQHCLGSALYNYMTSNNKKFDFSVDPNSSYPASYDLATNDIVIKNTSTLDFKVIQEEIFHAYQNYTVSGGTALYLNDSIPGRANIEFEAKLARDIMQYIDQIPGGDAVPDPTYTDWIQGFTDNFTKYPTSFSSAMQSEYYTYLAEFVQNNPGYNSATIDPAMTPTSLINLSNSSNCPK